VLFTEEDKQYLRMAGSILQKQTDAILDLWYNFVGSHPISFSILANLNSLIQPTWEQFVNASSNGFLTLATESMTRLGWTINEIGLRHHLTKKNQTDQVQSVPMMPLRYLIAFIYPITATIRTF